MQAAMPTPPLIMLTSRAMTDNTEWDIDGPEISNPCFVCGRDMDNPEVGMIERNDSEYECMSCYTGRCDRWYDAMKDRLAEEGRSLY